MNNLPMLYLGSIYLAGGLMLGHVLLHLFGFGHTPGLRSDPIGYAGTTLAYDIIVAAYACLVALLMFGLVGVTGSLRGWNEQATKGAALLAGFATLGVGVALERFRIHLAQQAAAARIQALVGLTGIVTSAIPEKRTGRGVVQLIVRMREQEFSAVTVGDEILEGVRVRVVEVVEAEMLAVVTDLDLQFGLAFAVTGPPGDQPTEGD